jgi:hypothetical protein
MSVKTSGRQQLQAMAGRNKIKPKNMPQTPQGFGMVTEIFTQMRRWCPSTWLNSNETTESLYDRADYWAKELDDFDMWVLRDVLDELVQSEPTSAPDLKEFTALCVAKLRSHQGENRQKSLRVAKGYVAQMRQTLKSNQPEGNDHHVKPR